MRQDNPHFLPDLFHRHIIFNFIIGEFPDRWHQPVRQEVIHELVKGFQQAVGVLLTPVD